ncbi:MAG: IS66 family insertion sequence element accessory protein TnpA [Casimicrobiaceae bacterium]
MKGKQDEGKARVWSERIAAFAASGLSRRAWCRQEGLNPNTLDYWRSRLRPATKALVPIVVSADSTADVEVALRGGVRLRIRSGTDPGWLAQLLGALTC